jgi:hypothetical protein
LFIVPWPCAGTSTASPSALKRQSTIRQEVSTLPAATAAGACAFTSEPAGCPREVESNPVAVDLDRRTQLEVALRRFEHVRAFVAAVGQSKERGPHDTLRVREELLHRSDDQLSPSPLAELGQALLGEPVGSDLRAEVATPLLGIAHLRDELREHLLVEPGGRDDDALLRERARARRHAAGLAAADVGVVSARDGEAGLGAGDERDVGEVRSARVRVVEDEDVLGPGVVLQNGRDCVRHRSEMDGNVLGLRDHPAAFVEERGRAVAPFLDVRGERGADERGAHLLRDRPESAAENLELNVHARVSLHVEPSLTPTHPGGSQQVDPSSSSTRGPDTS